MSPGPRQHRAGGPRPFPAGRSSHRGLVSCSQSSRQGCLAWAGAAWGSSHVCAGAQLHCFGQLVAHWHLSCPLSLTPLGWGSRGAGPRPQTGSSANEVPHPRGASRPCP